MSSIRSEGTPGSGNAVTNSVVGANAKAPRLGQCIQCTPDSVCPVATIVRSRPRQVCTEEPEGSGAGGAAYSGPAITSLGTQGTRLVTRVNNETERALLSLLTGRFASIA